MPQSQWKFIAVLFVVTLLLVSCSFPQIALPPDEGILEVDIDYSDRFYREVFDYSREAKNIRHFVLVLPESEMTRAGASWIFTSLVPLTGGLTVADDRQEYAWALDYIHEAPAGHFVGKFEPGTYAVAAAFIAAPLSREDAGVGEDVILWPGVTGGGASTDYEILVIEAGQITSITFSMTDVDGWACPWLYVFDGHTFERRTEILRNLRGKDHERTETTPIGPVASVEGFLVIRVAEEKDEVTFIDALHLVIDGRAIYAEADQVFAAQIAAVDGDYLLLHPGETYELRFQAPDSFTDGDFASVVVAGYYLPVR